MAEKSRAAPIGNAYRKKCGNITFVVSAYQNPNATKTANELILSMLKNKTKEREAV